MVTFLNLIAAEPEIARVPVMVDSSKWTVIEAGLKCVQGKGIVNSISLKEGEAEFLRRHRLVQRYGAAVVVMAFDEQGQADTARRKIESARVRTRCSRNRPASLPEDIIFDPNIFTVATGIEEHNNYAVDFFEATREHQGHASLTHRSRAASRNVSFSFRGNNPVREAIHSVFLYHAIRAGLDMGIVNAGMLGDLRRDPEDLREHVEDVLLNRRPDATERLVTFAESSRRRRAALEGRGPRLARRPVAKRLPRARARHRRLRRHDTEEARQHVDRARSTSSRAR